MDELCLSLKSLIYNDNNKELECREFLHYAKQLLMKETVLNFEYVEKEYRGHSGDSDYVISGTVRLPTGVECVHAYIWELKAPQCYIFEKDTENRLRPTKELIHAENQLLHYHYENKGNAQFRQQFGITHPDHVLIGGIIIGSRRTWVKGDFENDKKIKLYQLASQIRKIYFYDHFGLKLMTWDSVLEHMYSQPQKGCHYKNGDQLIHLPELSDKVEITKL